MVVAWQGVIPYLYLQGSVGAILTRKDDTDTQDIICQQLGRTAFEILASSAVKKKKEKYPKMFEMLHKSSKRLLLLHRSDSPEG